MTLWMIKAIVGQFFRLNKSHFLVLLQNNAELRATGGFITQVFDLEVGRGKIKRRSLDVFNDLSKHEKVEAPKAIQEMLFDSHLKSWTLRDANFDPDFHESAKQVIEFYNRVFPKNRVSGVLAVNFRFAERWLKALGPLEVENSRVVSEDLFHFLSAEASDIDRHDREALEKRKEILGHLASTMARRSLLRFWRWPALWGVWHKAFQEKDLQWFDPGATKKPWLTKADDFLAIVESNFLGLKSNRYIRRTIFHDTRLGINKATNEIRIVWEHFGNDNYPLSGHYRGHVRLFLPKNAKNIECVTQPEMMKIVSGKGHGEQVVEFRIQLNPQGQMVAGLRFELLMPLKEKRDYKFLYVKQPGVENETLRKTVVAPMHFSLESDQKTVVHEQTLFWDLGSVQGDQELRVRIRKKEEPPRIVGHYMDSKGIRVRFNEPIRLKDSSIEVHEKGNPKKGAKVSSTELDETRKRLLIRLSEEPQKAEVYYKVVLRDVKNDLGIPLSPNPRHITVVWRQKKLS